MIATYRAQEWNIAKARLKECRILCEPFGLNQLYGLYEARITEYEANPPRPQLGLVSTRQQINRNAIY